MPNINSLITDITKTAISSKLGGNQTRPSQNNKQQSNLSSNILQGITSTISSLASKDATKSKPSNQQPSYDMSYGQQGGYPGYPSQQGHPQSSPYAPYPSTGYPTGEGGPQPGSYGQSSAPPGIGFNVSGSPYPPTSDQGQLPYPGGQYPGQSPYPTQQQQQYQQPGQQPYQPQMGSSYGVGGYGGPTMAPNPAYPPYGGEPPGGPSGQYYYRDGSSGSANGGPNPPYQQQPPYSSSSGPGGYGSPMGPAGYSTPVPTMSSGNPTIRPNPNFNANQSAEMLRKAMKGFGCNNSKVVQALCNCSNWQRQEISRAFKTMYGKDLIENLKSELSGDFELLILALMEPPAQFDAREINRACVGIGTNEALIIEIMATRTNEQIHQLKQSYCGMYRKDIERVLTDETSGYFKRLMVSLCAAGRDESGRVDQVRANQDARSLYRAGEGRLGTDEVQFNAILVANNPNQLRLIFAEYQKIYGHSIEQAINSEFSGDIRDGHLALVKSAQNRPAYFAELLYNSMKGLGTRDHDLIRVIVTRSEIDLGDIRNEFQRLYKTPLEQMIAGDCSGTYKDALIALVKGGYA